MLWHLFVRASLQEAIYCSENNLDERCREGAQVPHVRGLWHGSLGRDQARDARATRRR